MAHPLQASDVYNRIGGQAALTQLIADVTQSETWNTDVLDLAMQDAWNLVIDAAGVQAELGGYTNEQLREHFPSFITVASQLALGLCWDYGTSGRAQPDGVKSLVVAAQAQLEMYSRRRRKHGAANYSPQPAQAIANIVLAGNDRMTLCGFRKTGGFG